jgi:Amino acid synthesis
MKVRKIVTIVEEIRTEGGREVFPPARIAVVAAVIENPWAGRGFVEDLNPGIDATASDLGALLAPQVIDALQGEPEAYGKAAIVGLDGEIEHGSGLIHTLKFGDHFRKAANATTLLPAVEKRGPAGVLFDIPLKHITDATIRSHHQTL